MTKQFELLGKEDTRSLALDETRFQDKRELAAARAFARKLPIKVRKTEKPVIIAMIGLPGSGKSTVAKEFAERIGGTVLEYDNLCLELRSRHVNQENAYNILGIVAPLVVRLGGNVIIDSDLVEADDQQTICNACRGSGARVLFVRTFADLSEVVARSFHNTFDLADDQKVVPLRRETESGLMNAQLRVMRVFNLIPRHYQIGDEEFPRYDKRRLACELLADIDTTRFNEWRREVEECVRRYLK